MTKLMTPMRLKQRRKSLWGVEGGCYSGYTLLAARLDISGLPLQTIQLPNVFGLLYQFSFTVQP
jgi:hypothetical protein